MTSLESSLPTFNALAPPGIGVLFSGLAMSHDVVMFSIPWANAPARHANQAFAKALPSPLLLTAAYSVLEPLATWMSLRTGWEPSVQVFVGSVLHIAVWVAATRGLREVHEAAGGGVKGVERVEHEQQHQQQQQQQQRQRQQREIEAGLAVQTPIKLPLTRQSPREDLPVRVRALFGRPVSMFAVFIPPLIAAAISNTGILLWAVGANLKGEAPVWQCLLAAAMLGNYCVIARFVDWELCGALAKARWFEESLQWRQSTATHVLCLVLGMAIRWGMRALLGIDPLLAFRLNTDPSVWESMRDPKALELYHAVESRSSSLAWGLSNSPLLFTFIMGIWTHQMLL